MYQEFYGLHEPPFELTANPKYLYLTGGHREALSNLEYGLSAAKAVTLLIGEAGMGKTTLLKAALVSPRCRDVRAVCVNNPTLTRTEFVEMLARSFSLSLAARQSKTALLEELESALHERRSRGQISALVVDEAQSLSTEILEEIRLLANIETSDVKLLPLVLVGQPLLATRLDEPGMRQLKQRVALRCEMSPLTQAETGAYIAARIRTAGGVAARIFTRQAVGLIHDYSQGLPRTINVVCDNALATGFALGRQPVDQEIVREVGRDFRLTSTTPQSRWPAAATATREMPGGPAGALSHQTTEDTEEQSEPDQAADYDRFRFFRMRRLIGR